ncbi:MAG: hypothetical protein VCB77_02435 [Alphaproteobacteria bacterium]
MGLTLTDDELPASPAFIEILHATLAGAEQHVGGWYAQEEENLVSDWGRFEDICEKTRIVMSHPEGKERIVCAYRLFKAILTGGSTRCGRFRGFAFFHWHSAYWRHLSDRAVFPRHRR